MPLAWPRRLLLAPALLANSLALAACPPGELTPPERVRLEGRRLLLVTHATSIHDARIATKRGVDEAVRRARESGDAVVFLQDDGPWESYFADDCAPDYRVRSEGGELGFAVPATSVLIAGGHLELCLASSVNELLLQWSRRPPGDLTMSFLMDAIYSNGKLIEPADPFYEEFARFLGIVTYGRPGGEHWPKLTLLETLGIIGDEDRQLRYLQRALPQWERTLPREYRVELTLNGERKVVLRAGKGARPPLMRFEFVDSALPDAADSGELSSRRPSP